MAGQPAQPGPHPGRHQGGPAGRLPVHRLVPALGQEYRSAPTPGQRTLARKLLADPSVDLILGHHAHVVQPVQRIHGKWVAFGMGNSLSAQSAACCSAATQDGVLVKVTVVRNAGSFVVGNIGYIPT